MKLRNKVIAFSLAVVFSLSLAAGVLASISGDANRDKKVNGLDYVVWFNNYKKEVTQGASQGDFNSDGKVNGLDYVVWFNSYQQTKTGEVESQTSSSRCVELINTAEGIRIYDTQPYTLDVNKEYSLTPVYVGPGAPIAIGEERSILWYVSGAHEPYLKLLGSYVTTVGEQKLIFEDHTTPITVFAPESVYSTYESYLTVKVDLPHRRYCKSVFELIIKDDSIPPVLPP